MKSLPKIFQESILGNPEIDSELAELEALRTQFQTGRHNTTIDQIERVGKEVHVYTSCHFISTILFVPTIDITEMGVTKVVIHGIHPRLIVCGENLQFKKELTLCTLRDDGKTKGTFIDLGEEEKNPKIIYPRKLRLETGYITCWDIVGKGSSIKALAQDLVIKNSQTARNLLDGTFVIKNRTIEHLSFEFPLMDLFYTDYMGFPKGGLSNYIQHIYREYSGDVPIEHTYRNMEDHILELFKKCPSLSPKSNKHLERIKVSYPGEDASILIIPWFYNQRPNINGACLTLHLNRKDFE